MVMVKKHLIMLKNAEKTEYPVSIAWRAYLVYGDWIIWNISAINKVNNICFCMLLID